MFTAVAQKNLADAEMYFKQHLAQNDYYAVGELRPGQWIGLGAERLGLDNTVIRELESLAAARVRKQGCQKARTTGNVVAAGFVHDSSRALDPQLHTHFTVFNATFDSREQSWKALQAGPMNAVALAVHQSRARRLMGISTAEAFALLERIGAVRELSKDKLHDAAASAYVKALVQGRAALLIAPTWSEIEAVTVKIRKELKSAGRLAAEEKEFEVFDSLSWTAAQKADAGQYRPGLAIRFHRRTGGFNKDESVEVLGVETDSLKVRRPHGSDGLLRLGGNAASYDVGEKRKLRVAAGDKLLLQSNWRKRFINGELVEVKAMAGEAIVLRDGRTLPPDYRTFTHGYAVTSHAAQGKTLTKEERRQVDDQSLRSHSPEMEAEEPARRQDEAE